MLVKKVSEVYKKIRIESFLALLLLTLPISFFVGSLFVNIYLFLILLSYIILKKNTFFCLGINKNNFPLFFFFCLISIVTAINNENNVLNIIKSIFLFKFFYLFLALEHFILSGNLRKYNKINYFVVLIYFLFFLDLLYQIYFKKNFFGYKPSMCLDMDNINSCQRFSGIFGNELIAGAFISTIIFGNFLLIKNIYNFKLIKLIPLILTIFTISTGERSASLIIFLFSLIFYFFLLSQYSFKKRIILFFLFFLSIVLFYNFVLNKSVKNRYYTEIIEYIVKKKHNTNLKNNFFTDSFENILHSPWGRHYYVSYFIFLDKPLFGHGLKSFREECKKYQQIVDKSCTTHPHNFHLEILNDGGIILYIIFIIAIINYIRVKNKLKKLNNEYLMYALMLVIFIFLPRPTGSLFSTTFGTMFWFLTAILLNNGLKKSE